MRKEILQTIIDHVPAMITMVDKEGRFILTNRDFESRLGWRLEELTEQNQDILAELYPDPQARQEVLDFVGRADGRWEDFRTRAKDGQVIDTSWAIVRLSDGAIIGVGKDITERKQMEKALRESEAKLKEAQQLAHIGYWERDLIEDRITGSEEAYRIFGLQPEEDVYSLPDLQEMIHPEDRQIQQQALSEALQGSRHYAVEYRIIKPDDEVRFVHVRDELEYDESGKPIRMFGAVQDITERKQAEEETRQTAARMAALAEISRTFVEAGLDFQGVLNTVAKRTAELIGDACIITLFSDDNREAFPVAICHTNPKALFLMEKALSQVKIPNTKFFQRLFDGQPIYLPVVDTKKYRDQLGPGFWPYFDTIGISSLLIEPLREQGRVIGVLSISRDRGGKSYTQDDQLLLQNIASRASLTIQNAHLFEQVQAGRQQLQVLSSQLLIAQEVERRTIARELHDEVGQILSGLMMQLGMAKGQLPKSAKAVQNMLEQSEELINQALERTRAIIAGLRPPVLEDLGLVPALRRLASEFQQNTGMIVEILAEGLPERLPEPLEVALFRIAQEGLTNIRKHAQAHRVRISLAKENEQVVLSVQDDGVGFEKQPAGPRADGDITLEGGWRIPDGHFGLLGIQERAAQLGGRLQVASAPGQGTTLRVELSLSKAKELSDERS